MLKSFKTEINPTKEQIIKINKTIGTCRYIYNFYIAYNKQLYEEKKNSYQEKVLVFGLTMNIFQTIQIKNGLKQYLQSLSKNQ